MEIIKSPMYATGVGLVLTGFRALDDRENKYMELSREEKFERRDTEGGKFFKKIIDRTKNLLIDDLDDKIDY
jgi:cell division protein FtsA